MSEVTGLVVGAILTLFILSYIVGDNPLYRLALHLFVGVLMGYSLGIVVREVMVGMTVPVLLSEPWRVAVPLVLGALLLSKGFRRHAYVGNVSLAYLIGVGVAVALGGALLGTLVPQVVATGRALSPGSLKSFRFGILDGLMVVVGTVSTLLSLTFVQPKGQRGEEIWGKLLGSVVWIGRLFLVVALGVAFAGALTASLSIFIGRLQYLIDVFSGLAGG